MSFGSINFNKNSPDLKKFVEQGWNSFSSFQEFEAQIDAKRRSPPLNLKIFSRFMDKSVTIQKRRAIFGSSNSKNSTLINQNSFGRFDLNSQEKLVIEDVSSDDEPKVKKIGLCTEKGNQIIVNLNRKKRSSVGDLESSGSDEPKSPTNNDHNLNDHCSLKLVKNFSRISRSVDRPNMINLPSRKNSTKTPKTDRRKASIELGNDENRSISDFRTLESREQDKTISSKPTTNQISPNRSLIRKLPEKLKNDSPITTVKMRPNMITHSTPKVTSKLNRLDQAVKHCSPLRQFNCKNDENNDFDCNYSRLKANDSAQSENSKTAKLDKPLKIKGERIARKFFNLTNTKLSKEFQTSTSPNRRPLSQIITTPDSPIIPKKNKCQIINFNIPGKRLPVVNLSITPTKQPPANVCRSLVPHVTPYRTRVKSTEIPASQTIVPCDSPMKGARTGATESRCFLKLSKKMEKLIKNHQITKMNETKCAEHQKQKLLYDLFESIYLRMEAQKAWLSANKEDDSNRDSLFLKLTEVTEPQNGFVNCDFMIDTSRMKKVILFKYSHLKTVIPMHYANYFQISCGAELEYISPWHTFDCDKLQITYIQNPFWINILDHGHPNLKGEQFEMVWINSKLDMDANTLLALTE